MESLNLNCCAVNGDYTKCYTKFGHLKGMLDRDQRTAKFGNKSTLDHTMCHNKHPRESQRSRAEEFHYEESLSHRTLPRSRVTNCFSRRTEHSYLYNSLQRLERVLYVGVYLLAVISVPSILSAPHTAPSRTMGEPRWWWNPCSDDSGIPGDSSDNSEEPVVNFSSLLLATDMALGQAETFKDEYARRTVGKTFDQFEMEYKGGYKWTVDSIDIPKVRGAPAYDDLILSLELEEALVNTYHTLQKIAVGLNQVYEDQNRTNGNFVKEFKDAKEDLRNLLCEMHHLIIECNFRKKPNVSEDIMNESARDVSNETFMNLRDFFIYRDYMNALEYVKQAFTHLKSKYSSD